MTILGVYTDKAAKSSLELNFSSASYCLGIVPINNSYN